MSAFGTLSPEFSISFFLRAYCKKVEIFFFLVKMRDLSLQTVPVKKIPLLVLFALAASFAVTRAPLSCVGPVAKTLQTSLGMDYSTYGVLTALPVLCFGIFGFATPILFSRYTAGKSLFIVLATLTLGLLLRTVESVPVLFLGTILIGASIAMINTVVPVILRHYYPEKIAFAMGVCTASVGISSFLGAAVAFPLEQFSGSYTVSLGVWALFAGPAALAWFFTKPEKLPDLKPRKERQFSSLSSLKVLPFLSIIAVMSMQAVCTFAVLGWLPAIFATNGISALIAGYSLAGLLVVAFMASLGISFLIRICGGERNLSIALTIFGLLSLPLWFMDGLWPYVGCFLMAIPHGARYSLAIILISKKARSLPQMLLLSSLAQGLGYSIAASGPFICGLLYKGDGEWMAVLIFLSAAILFWGLGAVYGFGKCEVFKENLRP